MHRLYDNKRKRKGNVIADQIPTQPALKLSWHGIPWYFIAFQSLVVYLQKVPGLYERAIPRQDCSKGQTTEHFRRNSDNMFHGDLNLSDMPDSLAHTFSSFNNKKEISGLQQFTS